MCDDIFDDFDECFENGDDFEGDEDFGQSSNDAGTNHDDCAEGIELDVLLALGFGYEMGYGERRRKQRRDPDEF